MHPENPARFRFDASAQALFIAWLTDLENRIREPDMGDVMRAHLAKYRKLMPVLAMLFALADGAAALVGLEHARMAAAWCGYLETHARRVYAAQASPAEASAHVLGQRLAAGALGKPGGVFKLRDTYRKGWSGLGTKEEALPALRCLEELGWVRPMPKPEGKPGRTSVEYTINPRLKARHAES